MCRRCWSSFPELKKSGDGVIINISATLHHGATWYQSHASAAKAAIDSLTRSLALEWGEYNIKVSGIAPGPIADTAGFTKLGGSLLSEAMLDIIPLHRLGTKMDIALMCVYLCSSAGTYVTGDTIVVDGGSRLWKPAFITKDMINEYSKNIEKGSREVGTAIKSKL